MSIQCPGARLSRRDMAVKSKWVTFASLLSHCCVNCALMTTTDSHSGYSGVGVEQVSQMVFDDKSLLALRGKGADFKESFDMGM